MNTPSPDPATTPSQGRALRRWMLTLAALFGVTLLIYLVSALLPLARPGGIYGGMGVMMMLPILLACAALAALLGSSVVAAIAWWAGVRRIGFVLVMLIAACLSAVSFIAGYDSPLGR